ncbi:hypothetical protein AK830_g4600 [Neonectria ditissima]|uniref:Uncharacterized protein n=1 Tax=Neonectria ditissima TaxID=78410 RepID=A0A0P7BL15_9HYPO|nr:hypothetical protein AK830_g4600 [Neonectria ditissima]
MAAVATASHFVSPTTTVHDQLKLTDLANELLLAILEFCPDIASLLNIAHTHPTLYYLAYEYQVVLAAQVLKNELPEEVYVHANLASRGIPISIGNPDDLVEDDITNTIGAVALFKDTFLSSLKSSILGALEVSRFHRKVVDLTEVCLRECFECRTQLFTPLQLSLERRKPSRSERIRIQQSIYLFEILRKTCKDMYVGKDQAHNYYLEFYYKLGELHISLMDYFLAPWEMYQVIAIQAFFRRALHGFERDETVSERAMPGLLTLGIPFLHEALFTKTQDERDEFIRPYEEEVLTKPIHAFGMVLSRGARRTWTRKQPKPHASYKRFGTEDASGVRMWERIEAKQLEMFTDDPQWTDMFDYELARLEGRLDLWSAALWDADRWGDILQTLSLPEPSCWKGIQHHCEPMELGFYIAKNIHRQHWMLNETVEG